MVTAKSSLLVPNSMAITACASKNAPVDLATPDIKQQEEFYIVIGELIINPIAIFFSRDTATAPEESLLMHAVSRLKWGHNRQRSMSSATGGGKASRACGSFQTLNSLPEWN